MAIATDRLHKLESMLIELLDHPEGVILPVRAQPGARKTGIRGAHGGALKVSVTQVAERGKANESLIDALAESLNLKRWQIELIAGETQARKRFLIRGVSRAELTEKINSVIAA